MKLTITKDMFCFVFFSNHLEEITFLNVQTLPESPTQDGPDATVSFYVHLPSGTMQSNLLVVIFSTASNVLSQPFSIHPIMTPNPDLTVAEIENLVGLLINTETTQVNGHS